MIAAPDISKPAYRVPLMSEIAAIEPNGYTIASTFSGCGGSCLGYRMAGYRVLWASEFVPVACESYRANFPDTILDTRDIRIVQAEEILEATGLSRGELDLLDGSPPCQPFSTAGKREKTWGAIREYGDHKQRADDLFFEYVRLVKGLQPRVFVAENVSGLIKGTAKGYFKQILAALKACGYVVQAKLLDAQWLGVPQARQRIIFVGVRSDLGLEPAFPKPLTYRYAVRDALPWLLSATGRLGTGYQRSPVSPAGPLPAIMASGAAQTRYEILAVSDDGFDHARPTGIDSAGDITDRPAPAVLHSPHHFRVEMHALPPSRARAYDGEAVYGLTIVDPEKPSPTVTIGSAGNDIALPIERRKFTIAELRRICAFPDDFILCGSYAEQWARLGNAVPPVMMQHIAATIRDDILNRSVQQKVAV